jgi:hypothetical protein
MKVAAREAPLTTIPHLMKLNDLVIAKPRIALFAMQTAEQMYASLLPDRVLKSFSDYTTANARDSHLILFYFEDQLKHT